MLVAAPPFSSSDMSSLVPRAKLASKMSLVNNSGSSLKSDHSSLGSNGKHSSNTILSSPRNSKYSFTSNHNIRNNSLRYLDQRKIRNSTDALQAAQSDLARDLLKQQEETKRRCVQDTQQCEGCFATIMEASHSNFVIPCIPLHLSSTRNSST